MKPRGFEFEQVLTTDPSKSWFDLSFKNKFTANFGKLYPFYRAETMPGDRFKLHSNLFSRLMPLLSPVMQNVDIFSYFFYVPNRIIWPKWKKFASNGDGSVKMVDADSYIPPTHPYLIPFDYLLKCFGFLRSSQNPSVYTTVGYAPDSIFEEMLKNSGVDIDTHLLFFTNDTTLNDNVRGYFILVHTTGDFNADFSTDCTIRPYSEDDYHHFFQLFDFLGAPCNYEYADFNSFKVVDSVRQSDITYEHIPVLASCVMRISKVSEDSEDYIVDVDNIERFSLFAPPASTAVSYSKIDYISGHVCALSRFDSFYNVEYDPDIDYINAFPFKAYERIWNEYFRSQDYQDQLDQELFDGYNTADELNPYTLQSKCYEHDYFTSILPDAQRGPDVTLSLAGTAPLVNDKTKQTQIWPTSGQWPLGAQSATLGASKGAAPGNNPLNAVADITGGSSGNRANFDITSHTKVDLSGVSAITINALRYANTLQRYEEALARSGSRYNEMLIAIYGVVSSDASIQRPIFIGASRTPVQISDVAQTSEGSETPLATLAGRGIAVGDTYTDFYSEEFGWILGVCAIVPRTQYFQGLDRHLHKFVNLDYPIPMFANLGEQEVLKSELYASGRATDKALLGYLPRYSEFKYHSDEIHGALKGSLKYWTMARTLFPNKQVGAVIDGDFLRADQHDYDAFAYIDDSSDHFIIECDNEAHVERSLPEYSIPHL